MGEVIKTEFGDSVAHKVELSDKILAKNIGEILHRHYPGHLWAIHVDSEGGVVNIRNLRVSFLYGYVFHIKNLYPFDSQVTTKIINAGGEILERAAIARGKSDQQNSTHVEGVKERKTPNIVI